MFNKNLVSLAKVMSIETFLKEIKPNVLYGFLPTPIVGIKHASGSKNLKESAWLNIVREPENQYDKNACRIDTKQNIKVGYISALFAEKVRPIIDKDDEFKSVGVNCVTLSTPQEYDITGALVFFGPEKTKESSISNIRNLIPSYLDGGTWFSTNTKKRKIDNDTEEIIPKKAKRSAGWCKSFVRDTDQLTTINSARTVITPVKITTKNDNFQKLRCDLNTLVQEYVNACQDENNLKTGMRLKLETLMQNFESYKTVWKEEDYALEKSYLEAISK